MNHIDESLLVLGVTQQTANVGQQNQLLCSQCNSQLSSSRIRIDIVGSIRIHALGHSGNHGNISVLQCGHNGLGIDFDDFAHQAVLLIQACCLEHLTVHTAQANSIAAQTIQLCHKVLVDLAAQDRLDNIHGGLIGIAQAIHKMRLVADLLQHVGNFRTAAMDNDHTDTNQMQQDNILHNCLAQLLGNHSITAVLHHDGLAGKLLDIGQCLDQSLGLLSMGGHKRHSLVIGLFLCCQIQDICNTGSKGSAAIERLG